MKDRHESEVRHHQNKIDRDAEEAERIQAERQAISDATDWKEVGEKAIRDMSNFDKADIFNETEVWKLANFFDYLVMHTTDWTPPKEGFHKMNIDIAVKEQLKEIRDNQADLAEEHFMQTGEME